jgi:hypothetical protein
MWKPIAALTLALCTSSAHASYQSLGAPFPATCYGILEYRETAFPSGPDYYLDTTNYPDQQIGCGTGVIAQRSRKDDTKYLLPKYTLKEATNRRLLKACTVGKFCEISGHMNGMSHDIFFWVDIYSIVPSSETYRSVTGRE